MKKTLLLLFILATLSALGQVRPPLEANTVRALTELDARKTIKFRTDSLDKAVMAYVEWNANCFRFKRLAAGSAWSSWICAPDEVTLDANAKDVFEIPSGKLTFKSTGKNMALRVDASNKYEFAGTIILNDDYTAFGKNAAVIGYDTVVYGSDTTYVPVYDNVHKNVILLGHNSKASQDSTAFIGDSTIKQLWIAGSLNTKGILLEGDSAYMKHLVLQEADSGKIAKHMGKTIAWVDDDPDSLYFQGAWYVMGLDSISFADSIQINGQWVKFGESLTFPDSIQINGEWVHLGGSVTIAIPDAQTLSWNPTTGEITILGGNTVDIDGRYLTSETPQNLSWNPTTGALGIDGGTGVDLDGRYLIPPTAADGDMMVYGAGSWYATAPIDERVSVIDSEGVKSAPALLYADDFSVSQVGGAVDDWVVMVKPDSIYSEVAGVWIKKGDTIPTQEFELYLEQESKWIASGDTIPEQTVSANIGGATLLGNFTLSDTITHPIGFTGTSLEILSWNGNTIDGFTNAGGYLTVNEDLNLTVNQNYKVDRSQDSFIESVLFLEINNDMFELPYTSGNESQGTWNSGTMSFALSAGDEVRAHVFSRWIGTAIPAPEYTYVNWTGYMTAIKSVVGDIVEYDPLSIHKTDTLFYVSDGTTAEPVLQGDTIAKTGTLGMKDIWTGTQAEYDLIGTPDANTVYFINNGWWVLAFLLLFSFSGFGQKWDAVKIGSMDIVRIYQGANIIWEKESTPSFPEVTIGTQTWMAVNLDIDDLLGGIYAYGNNEANVATYGRLYTWDAAMRVAASIDGWHLPSDAEWTTLTTYLGGESVAGGKLKETGTTHWNSPNTGATNETGFTALPGGARIVDGTFLGIGFSYYGWSATEYDATKAWNRYAAHDASYVGKNKYIKGIGYPVRLIKDTP